MLIWKLFSTLLLFPKISSGINCCMLLGHVHFFFVFKIFFNLSMISILLYLFLFFLYLFLFLLFFLHDPLNLRIFLLFVCLVAGVSLIVVVLLLFLVHHLLLLRPQVPSQTAKYVPLSVPSGRPALSAKHIWCSMDRDRHCDFFTLHQPSNR